MDAEKLITKREVISMIGFGRTWISKHIADGSFPKPLRFAGNSIRWRLSDVEQWLQDQSKLLDVLPREKIKAKAV